MKCSGDLRQDSQKKTSENETRIGPNRLADDALVLQGTCSRYCGSRKKRKVDQDQDEMASNLHSFVQ